MTTLLDDKLDPAPTLIVLYHEKWEEELTIDGLKTHQGERLVLRSQTSGGVVQELYGLMLGHFVIRGREKGTLLNSTCLTPKPLASSVYVHP